MKNFLTALTVLFAFTGCLKKESDFCDIDTCSTQAPASEVQAVETYLANNAITATKHCSGLYYRIETAGGGANPRDCSTIGITYKGQLTNGNVFDQSASPVSFRLSQLIMGWRNSLPLLKAGGKIHLYIPPSLGYGSQDTRDANGTVIIPGNSILIFEINLISVQ